MPSGDVCLSEAEIRGFAAHYPRFAELLPTLLNGRCCVPQDRYRTLFTQPPARLPFVGKLRHLVSDLKTWLMGGGGMVGVVEFRRRKSICRKCPFWDARGWGGTGQCGLCGCSTAVRLRMAGVGCPDTPPRW